MTPISGPPGSTPRTGAAAVRVLVVSDSLVLCAGMRAVVSAQGLAVAGVLNRFDLMPLDLSRRTADVALVCPANGPSASLIDALCGPLGELGVVVLLSGPAVTTHTNLVAQVAGGLAVPLSAAPSQIVGALLRVGGSTQIATERMCCGPGGTLTRREQQVLDQLAQGASNQLIATELGIGEQTVKTHLTNVYRKLKVCSRTEAIAAYLKAS